MQCGCSMLEERVVILQRRVVLHMETLGEVTRRWRIKSGWVSL